MKIKEIEELLNYLENIFKQNPGLSEREIYSLLIYYRASKTTINNFFPNWVDYYMNKENISSFVDPNWAYFCQFINKKVRGEKAIKLYVPLKPEVIENGAKLIFNFLAEQNIPHLSKIGSHSRNDNLVIRVDCLNDALKIIEFVKGNKYLQNGLIKTNPLVFNVNGVGLALDGNLSYNDELSKLLWKYLLWRRQVGLESKPNALEFSKFIAAIESKSQNSDMKTIYKLILENATGEINMLKYINILNDYQENEMLLNEALSTTRNKYGDKHVMAAIKAAVNNYFGYITNDNGLRDRVIHYLNGYQIKRIVSRRMGYDNNDSLSDQELYNYAINTKNTLDIIREKIEILKIGVIEMINRYAFQDDFYKICEFINEFLTTFNYRLFTRDKNIRSNIERSINPNEDIVSMLRQYYQLGNDYNQYDVIKVFVERELFKKMSIKR